MILELQVIALLRDMWAAHPPGLTYTALHVPEYGEVIT